MVTPSKPAQQMAKPVEKKPNTFLKFAGLSLAVVVSLCCVMLAGLALSGNGTKTQPPTVTPGQTKQSTKPGACLPEFKCFLFLSTLPGAVQAIGSAFRNDPA